MGSFKRALLGYRRQEVDAAMSARDTRISALERDVEDAREHWGRASEVAARAEQELTALSGMVIERERVIHSLSERLQEAEGRHERSIASLEIVASRLEEVHSQARSQATRIRMKALREAVEVSRRAEELAGSQASGAGGGAIQANAGPAGNPSLNGETGRSDSFQGRIRLEIGPLGDFSQLVGFEDAVGQLGVSDISVERFSEGRATLSMNLDQPVELLRELEERAPLDFRVRRTSGEDLILDIDEDQGPEQHAA